MNGYVRVTNTGTANATIGSIVVNLQKKAAKNPQNASYVSVAADCANATNGDSATTCKIVAAGSAENVTVNAAQGAGNYTVSGAQGTFVETAASGSLNFTDASNNTVFSLSPQISLAPSATISLKYTATFNNTILGLAAGADLRSEVLVSFGNAGARGGSGASATNIDINGNGAIDTDEKNVRTVPCRVQRFLPKMEKCNDTVTLSDDSSDVSTTGTVTYTNFVTDIGGGTGTEVISTTATRSVSVDIDGGASGGTITNTAFVDGQDSFVTVNGPIDPLTGQPKFSYTFPCCVGIHLQAPNTVNVAGVGFTPGQFCTVTQGGWGAPPNGNNPGAILDTNYATVYPSGFVEVGIPGASGFSIKLNGAGAVCKYLPAGGTPGTLTSDIVSSLACGTGPSLPTTSSGVFGGQTLALKLNVDFNNALILGGTSGPISGLMVCNLTASDSLSGSALTAAQVTALNGQTITQVLAEANTVLGGGTGSYGLTVTQLNDLADKLNNAFDGCTSVSAFAAAHLCQ